MHSITERSDSLELFCYDQKVEEPTTQEKIVRCVYDVFSVVFFPLGLTRLFYRAVHWAVGKMIVPAQSNRHKPEKQEKFRREHGAKDVVITTRDGVHLEAMYAQGKGAKRSDPTIIFFNPNSSLMRNQFVKAAFYMEQGFNVVMFNYRGTGRSEGYATRDGLLEDGRAVCAYVKSLTQDNGKIVLNAHSLGGAIATHVAEEIPGCHIVSDRSFSSLSKTVNKLFFWPLGTFGISLGWELDSTSKWKNLQGKRWIIHAPDDNTVHKAASLYSSVKDSSDYDDAIEFSTDMVKQQLQHCGYDTDALTPRRFGKWAHDIFVSNEINAQLARLMKEATGMDVLEKIVQEKTEAVFEERVMDPIAVGC